MDLINITTESHNKKEFQCKQCSNQFSISFKDFLQTKYGKVEMILRGIIFVEFRITEGFDNSTENVMEFMKDAKSIAGNRHTKIKRFITNKNFCHLILSC